MMQAIFYGVACGLLAFGLLEILAALGTSRELPAVRSDRRRP